MKRRKFMFSTGLLAVIHHASMGQQTVNGEPFIVRRGEARNGVRTPFKGINDNDVKISGRDTQGQLAVFEYFGNEKTGPALHLHMDQDEFFHVVEGTLLFQVGKDQYTLQAGDMIFAPRGVPHTWLQLSATCHLIYGVQPAGKLEEFFIWMNDHGQGITFEEVQRIHKEHGMEVVGPALTLE